MRPARHRCTSDDVPILDADYIRRWGAFEPARQETVTFPGFDQVIGWRCDGERFQAFYQWEPEYPTPEGARPVTCSGGVAWRPCRLGGQRPYFVCPGCGRHKLKLAVLPEGLLCAKCGRVQYASRREQPLERMIRKCEGLAHRLDLDDWYESPEVRPKHMRIATFERLAAEHEALRAPIIEALARMHPIIRQRYLRPR